MTPTVEVDASAEDTYLTTTPKIATVAVDATPEIVFVTVSPTRVTYEVARS